MIPKRKTHLKLIILVPIALVLLFWRGRQLFTTPEVTVHSAGDYGRQILDDEARIKPSLGQNGVEVIMNAKNAELGLKSLNENGINVYLSDQIPYERSLIDLRNPACKEVIYDAELPSVSVILVFHNEPYSVILRTVWSVLNSCRRSNHWFQLAGNIDMLENILRLGYPGQQSNSEFVYLKEIILVDDRSTLPELKGKLSHYVRTRLPSDLVRVLRLPKRKGLVQARMAAARIARGKVLLFLDAHCEVSFDWLRPLLQRIVDKESAVVTPIIDIIDENNFGLVAATDDQVAGFNFDGVYTWLLISKFERDRRGSEISPTWSPTMAGGLFAIDRAYFWQLGGYDEQMSGWGGENLEMSFRVWMCGGSIEVLPCSRIGHIFKDYHQRRTNSSNSGTFAVNMARTAEVWMDDYKELFYLYRMELRNNPVIGDVTHRKILREKLQCNSFQWYLDHVYRDKFVPIRDVFAWGRIMNPTTSACIDRHATTNRSDSSLVMVSPCLPLLKHSQLWSLADDGRLRSEAACIDVVYYKDKKKVPKIIMVYCKPPVLKRQKFLIIADDHIQHQKSGLCIEAHRPGDNIRLSECDRASTSQIWKFDFTQDSPLAATQRPEMADALQFLCPGEAKMAPTCLAPNFPAERPQNVIQAELIQANCNCISLY